jgi:hypothetical protein
MFGQRTGAVHQVEDHRGQQRWQSHAWFATATVGDPRLEGSEQFSPGGEKTASGYYSSARRLGGFGRSGVWANTSMGSRMLAHSYVESETLENRKQIYLNGQTLHQFRKALHLARILHDPSCNMRPQGRQCRKIEFRTEGNEVNEDFVACPQCWCHNFADVGTCRRAFACSRVVYGVAFCSKVFILQVRLERRHGETSWPPNES